MNCKVKMALYRIWVNQFLNGGHPRGFSSEDFPAITEYDVRRDFITGYPSAHLPLYNSDCRIWSSQISDNTDDQIYLQLP